MASHAVPVPVLQKSQEPLASELLLPATKKRIMPKQQVVRVESQHGKLLGIKIVRAFNFLPQIVAGSSQPFTRVNIRLAEFEVASHLRMNNLRLVHKEGLCEES